METTEMTVGGLNRTIRELTAQLAELKQTHYQVEGEMLRLGEQIEAAGETLERLESGLRAARWPEPA